VVELLVADDSVDRHTDLLRSASALGIRVTGAPTRAVDELAGTVAPQGVVAVCQMVDVANG
jgi:TrmH family RNA methyltransferase